MTTGRRGNEDRNPDGSGRSGGPTRRRVLSSAGGGLVALLAGCTTGGTPDYVEGEVDVSGNASNATRSASEMSAAASIAEVNRNESASQLEALELEDHEFVLEEGFKGPTVQGTVRNTGDERITYAEVRVRVFDSEGSYLGHFLDSVVDLGAGTSWSFEVIVLSSPEDIARYDIAVLGIPE